MLANPDPSTSESVARTYGWCSVGVAHAHPVVPMGSPLPTAALEGATDLVGREQGARVGGRCSWRVGRAADTAAAPTMPTIRTSPRCEVMGQSPWRPGSVAAHRGPVPRRGRARRSNISALISGARWSFGVRGLRPPRGLPYLTGRRPRRMLPDLSGPRHAHSSVLPAIPPRPVVPGVEHRRVRVRAAHDRGPVAARPTGRAPAARDQHRGVVGVAAAAVAIAAWVRSRWLPWAIGIWGVCVGGMMYEFQSRMGTQGEPVWLVVFPYLMLVILTWLLVAFGAGRV